MLAAVRGVIRGNTVIIEDDIQAYDGTEVVVTMLEYAKKEKQAPSIDWESFKMPSKRGKNVDQYMREMRDHDRI